MRGSKALDQLLEHEGCASERSVEGGGEARARARSQEGAAVAPGEAECASDQRGARLAPICTVGPSRPSARPAPIASTPPTNLTGASK